MGLITSICAIFVLLAISSYLSSSETALLAASRLKLHQLKKKGDKKAGIVESLKDGIEEVIAAVLMYNNLANILASSLATGLLIEIAGEAGIAYATLVMTVLVLFFGEVVPKMFAVNNPEKVALSVAPVVRLIVLSATSVTKFLRRLAQLFLESLGIQIRPPSSLTSVHEELRGVIDYHAGSHQDVTEERNMLNSILDLASVTVDEIIVHRKNVTMLDASLPVTELVEQVLKSPYTRFPVWQGDPDNIQGVLHAKDLLRAVKPHEKSLQQLDILSLASKPWFIPESITLLDQLQAFRRRREHFALVVDEYGDLLGTITLEDILEEIVGDISDEHDVSLPGVVAEGEGSLLVAGDVTIRDLNREFGWHLPDEEASTISGLVLFETATIPVEGQVFLVYGFRIEIIRRVRNQITQVRLIPPQDAVL